MVPIFFTRLIRWRYECVVYSFVSYVFQVTLHAYEWNAQEIINKYKDNSNEVLVYSHVKPRVASILAGSSRTSCAVCASTPPLPKFSGLACGHYFCNDCWAMHFEVQIMQGRNHLFLISL